MKHTTPALFWMVTLLLLGGCSDEVRIPSTSFEPVATASRKRLAVVTSTPSEGDGKLLVLELERGKIIEASHRLDRDPVIARLPGAHQISVLNRKRGSVQMVDDSTLKLITEFRGADVPYSNFQDVVEVGNGEAYFSSYETSDLYRIRIQDGKLIKTISLKRFADDDGIPESFKMFSLGNNRVALILQRLNHADFTPAAYSSLLVINSSNNEVEDEVKMQCDNPATATVVGNPGASDLAIGCVGGWNAPFAGSIQLVNLGQKKSKRVLWIDSELKRRPTVLAAISPLFMASILMTSEFKTQLAVSGGNPMGTPAVWAEESYEEGFRSLAIDVERRLLWVGKSGKAEHRLLAYSLDTQEVVRSIPMEFTPIQLEWLD